MQYKAHMESKLRKQISSFCHLDFSNTIIRKPKGLFYTKNVLQNPINFRKKSEKISLKNFNQDIASPYKKNTLEKIQQIKPLSPNQKNINQPNIKNLSCVKSSTRLVSPKDNIKKLPQYQSSFKLKLHKSLQQQPQRVRQPQRNPILELRNTGLKKIAACRKSEKPINFRPSNFINHKPSGNLFSSSPLNSKKLSIQFETKNVIPQTLVQKRYETQFTPIRKLNKSIEKISNMKFSPKKEKIQRENLQSTNQTQKQKQQSLSFKQPLIRKVKPKSTVDIDKFQQIYGEFEIQEEIKYDLLVQKQTIQKKLSKQKENNTGKQKIIFSSQQIKHINPEQSIKSLKQMNQSKDNINNCSMKIQIQQLFYGSSEKEKSQKLNTFQQLQRVHYYPSCNLDNYQFKNQQRLRESSISIQSQISIQGQYINSLQFRQKCQRTDNFKSIVSVHSQSVSDQEVEASVIINKHPKEIISSRPIRTLF